MAESYGIDISTLAGYNLLAGSHPVVFYPVVLGSGSGNDLDAGQVLGRNSTSFKYYKWDPDATDGTEVARAILAKDTDASSADANTVAFVHGEFRKALLLWNTTDAAKIAKGMRDLQSAGIFVKADQA